MRYIWTSGRKCNFAGCDRPDLQPPNVNGWFWSGSGAKIGPTTQRNTGDWSATGGYGQAQPDNREAPQVNINLFTTFISKYLTIFIQCLQYEKIIPHACKTCAGDELYLIGNYYEVKYLYY